MPFKLRVARATNQINKIADMYQIGLELEIIGRFHDHNGFDGVMLGSPGSGYHLEFTQHKNQKAPSSSSPEDLLVFYVPNLSEAKRLNEKMIVAGFKKVAAHNPYWDKFGNTYEDLEGFRVVICQREWTAN